MFNLLWTVFKYAFFIWILFIDYKGTKYDAVASYENIIVIKNQ